MPKLSITTANPTIATSAVNNPITAMISDMVSTADSIKSFTVVFRF